MKKAAAVFGLVLALCGVLVARAALMRPAAGMMETAPPLPVDPAAVRRMSEAIRIPTVTEFGKPANIPQFLKFHEHLRRSFPLVHQKLAREVIDSGALMFTWKGSDTTLAPVVLMGHQDVVPVEPGTEKEWKHGAFSGDTAGGELWGRGALDDKVSVMGLLEATEALLASGFTPRRTLILSFGHTEEGLGAAASHAVELLQRRKITPWFVMDEGGAVGDGLVPGVAGRVAVVGVAEKGYVSLRLTAKSEGGHSSMPPKETAVSIVGAAVAELQENRLPARIDGATLAMFNTIAPHLAFGRRIIFANLWLFKPLLSTLLGSDRTGNAMVRTTTAATMISGGIKDNVVPSTATAIVNFRLMPGDSVAWLVAKAKSIIDDPRVTVEIVNGAGAEASRVSSDTAAAFKLISDAIAKTYGTMVVAPYLVVGGTDSRQFERVSPNVYRFAPIVARGSTMSLVHGINERTGVADYLDGVRFFRRLMEAALK